MTKWKWALAAQVPAKLFVVNENGDFFWVDYTNWRIIVHFFLFRAGLTGAEAVPTLTRLALFPFTLLFLLDVRRLGSSSAEAADDSLYLISTMIRLDRPISEVLFGMPPRGAEADFILGRRYLCGCAALRCHFDLLRFQIHDDAVQRMLV